MTIKDYGKGGLGIKHICPLDKGLCLNKWWIHLAGHQKTCLCLIQQQCHVDELNNLEVHFLQNLGDFILHPKEFGNLKVGGDLCNLTCHT